MCLPTYFCYKYVRRHTCNSLFSTTIAAYQKDTVFFDGECLHDTIKGAAQRKTFLTIKLENMIHIKFALFFCVDFSG